MAGGIAKFPVWFWPTIVGVCVGIFLLITLLPMSFSYLDFYHFGFLRRHTTGRVNIDKVYVGGRYFVGPDYQ
jgi:hypothetical protein